MLLVFAMSAGTTSALALPLHATEPAEPAISAGAGAEPTVLAAAFAPADGVASDASPFDPPPDSVPAAEVNAGPNAAQGLRGSTAEGAGANFGLAPVQWWGLASVDLRDYRYGTGARTTQEIVQATINGATYLWQPWFAQVRAGIGVLGAAENGNQGSSSNTANFIGNASIALLPVSRFPFNAYVDVNDSRANGDVTGIDYRNQRFGVNQSYTPPSGNQRYFAAYDQSTIRVTDNVGAFATPNLPNAQSSTPTDVVQTWRMSAARAFPSHSFDLQGLFTRNRRTDINGGYGSNLYLISGTHNYNPNAALAVNSLASYTGSKFDQPSFFGNSYTNTQFAQFNSFATYRPQPAAGEMYQPFYATGNVRAFQIGSQTNTGDADSYGTSGAFGLNYQISQSTQLFSSTQVGYFGGTGTNAFSAASQTFGANYAPTPIPLGNWRYQYNVDGSGTYAITTADNQTDVYRMLGTFNQTFSRLYPRDDGSAWSLSLNQGVGQAYGSYGLSNTTFNNAATMSWRAPPTASSQAFASATVSDSRAIGTPGYEFQMVNVQATQQQALSRDSTWSGNLTVQATRSVIDQVNDPFQPIFNTAPAYNQGQWFTSYGANLTYVQQRVFDIPRLRFTALALGNSYPISQRQLGDTTASIEQVTWSMEGRLEYFIGRLELRLTARVAEVQGQQNVLVFFRIARAFGQM